MTLFVDVFGLKLLNENYSLRSFELKGKNASRVASRLAYRICKELGLPAAWVYAPDYKLVASSALDRDSVLNLLQNLQRNDESFRVIEDILEVDVKNPSSNIVSTFIVRGLLFQAEQKIRSKLSHHDIDNVLIERVAELTPLVISNLPAVQIAISSQLISKQTLSEYYRTQNLSPEGLKGFWVSDKFSASGKGEIVAFRGYLRDLRKLLLDWKPKEEIAEVIENSPDDDPVYEVDIDPTKNPFSYPIGALNIIVQLKDLGTMGVDATRVTNLLKINPSERNQIVSVVEDELRKLAKGNAVHIYEAFDSKTYPQLFKSNDEIKVDPSLRFANGERVISKDKEMIDALTELKLYKIASKYQTDRSIRIGIIDALSANSNGYQRLQTRLSSLLKKVGFSPLMADVPIKIDINTPDIEQRAKIEEAISKLASKEIDIILIFLPTDDRQEPDEDTSSLYYRAKSICIGRGIPNQVVYEDTLNNMYADANILMGILGKTGNIPFVLGTPLPYANKVVGLDVSRRNGINMAAMSRIYVNTGQFVGYSVASAPIKGETIPKDVLEKVLSGDEFGGDKVVVHRDGRFMRDELNSLFEWGKYINATFYPVEVTKTGASRIYRRDEKNVVSQAPTASAFLVSKDIGYVVSNLPPAIQGEKTGTAMPLKIRNCSEDKQFTLRDAIHSVLALTLLHYGALRPPKLPVSTHSSDKIAKYLTRGIFPDREKGDIPFWY